MTLPEGITAATVTVGVAMTVAGTPVKTHITIEASAPLIHVATGTPLVEVLEDVTLAAGASGSFTLPHTDQAGFEDGAGNAYTDWYYTARITYGERIKGKTQPARTKIFQIPTGQDLVDLDLLPEGAAAVPWSAPAAAVSSFEGRTGPVTLLETDLPERLSDAELSATYGIVLKASGAPDHTTEMNAALSAGAALGVKKHVTFIGDFLISAPLIIGSNTTVDAYSAKITQIVGSSTNMVRSSAHAPLRTVTDAAMTAASAVVTSATAAFTSADVGRNISVAGAGTSVGTGGIKPLYTTIVSVESATSATVALAAITTVSGVSLSVYTRATDIRLLGGTWDRQNNDGLLGNKHALRLLRVDRLHIADQVHASTGGGKYSLNVGDVSDFTIERITGNPGVQADLVHINGPAHRGVVRHITGTSHDDLVGVTPMDFADYSDISGPITDMLFSDIMGDPGAAVPLKFTGSSEQGCFLARIRARNIAKLNTDTEFYAIRALSDCGTLDIRDITIENVQGRLYTQGGTIKSLTVTASHLAPATANPSYSFFLNVGTDIKTLNIESVTNTLTATSIGPLVLLQGAAKIGQLNITDVNWEINSGYLIQMNESGPQITAIRMTNVRHYCPAGGGGLITANVAGAILSDVYLSNVETANSAWLGDIATVTRFWLNGYRGVQLLRVRPTGNITIRGAGIDLTSTTLTVDSGGVLRSLALDLPADVSKLAKNNGDRATNNNAALACGVGPVVSDGTNWKHLYTAAIY